MGYQVATVRLADGRTFDRVAIIQCEIVGDVFGLECAPFDTRTVVEATVTHDKWPFRPQSQISAHAPSRGGRHRTSRLK